MRKTIHLLLTAMAAVCLITDSAAGALMTLHSEALQPDGSIRQIGRASCREGV